MKLNWEELRNIGIAGAIGGLAGWLIACSTMQDWGSKWSLDLSTALVCGALAGCAAVYLIANTDTREMKRCLTFAAICGLSWKPVLDTGIQTAQSALAHKQVSKATDELQASIGKAGSDPKSLTALVTNATDLTTKLSTLPDSPLQQTAADTAAKALTTAAAAPTTPAIDPDQIAVLWHKASSLNLGNLRNAAKSTLDKIAKDSPKLEDRTRASLLSKGL